MTILRLGVRHASPFPQSVSSFLVHRFPRLGLGKPLLISASHGDGMADIARALVPHYEIWEQEQQQQQQSSEVMKMSYSTVQ